MASMDDTPIEELVSELEAADPADAPEVADAVAAELARRLDPPDAEASDAPQA
jgi:hypothetical protein